MTEEHLNPKDGPETASEPPSLSFFDRLLGVYIEPKKTFEDIGRKQSWFGIFAVVGVLAIASWYIMAIRMDTATFMEKSQQASRRSAQSQAALTDQQKEAQERVVNIVRRYVMPPGTGVMVLVAYLAIAGAFLLLFVILGAGLTFRKTLAVTCWAMAPPSIVASIIAIAIVWVKDPEKMEIEPISNVISNLGILVQDRKAQPALYSLLSSIDVFSAWTIALLTIGFVAVSDRKLSTGKALMGTLVLWAIWVLVKTGMTVAFR
jgi:Flp pilus assembly protein TadB